MTTQEKDLIYTQGILDVYHEIITELESATLSLHEEPEAYHILCQLMNKWATKYGRYTENFEDKNNENKMFLGPCEYRKFKGERIGEVRNEMEEE